jgi:putative inorganic carbon (hco3(-)) transporter
MTRVYGTLQTYNPNLFGGYLVATLPCLFGSFVLGLIPDSQNVMLNSFQHLKNERLCDPETNSGRRAPKKLFLFLSLSLSLITSFALILSGCRGAYIGLLAIGVCIFGFLAKFIWEYEQAGKEIFKKIYLSVLGSIVAFSTCIILFISSIRTRVFSIFAMRSDSSTSFRLNVYQSSINMFKDNWLFGIGIGNQNFREIYGIYMRTGFDALSAYCVFLEIAVESGIFALLAFLAFLGTLVYKAIKFILNNKDLKLTAIVAISITSILAVMVHGLVDTIFFRPQVQFIFWTMVAFVSSITATEKSAISKKL